MERIPGYDHQDGRHCGSTALANVAQFYGWDYDEAACFGLGTGVWAATFDHPRGPWGGLLARAPWLEAEFFDVLDVPYVDRSGDDFETAWDGLTGRLDGDDPTLAFLDPIALPNVADSGHVTPHVAVVIGYGDDAVLLSDSVRGVHEMPLETFRDAWRDAWAAGASNRYVVVQDHGAAADEGEAANRALRRTTGYMLEPYDNARVYGTYGDEHGVGALRTFADEVARWPDLESAADPALFTYRHVDHRGGGAGYRRLYADALDLLAPDAGLGTAPADRMRRLADEWESAAESLEAATATDDERRRASIGEAAGVFGAVADAERTFFEDIREQLRGT
ncbi:MAG: DUF4872 domain-containing protein [Haloferacaceae archaeon]